MICHRKPNHVQSLKCSQQQSTTGVIREVTRSQQKKTVAQNDVRPQAQQTNQNGLDQVLMDLIRCSFRRRLKDRQAGAIETTKPPKDARNLKD